MAKQASDSLVIHCGGNVVEREALFGMPLPEATKSYQPVAHSSLVEMVEFSIARHFGIAPEAIDAAYGVSADKAQMFACFGINLDSDEHGISIGLRNSLDKKFSAGLAIGARVFVCDNLAFSSSGINVFRKHTPNIERDIRHQIDNAITLSTDEYRVISDSWDKMKSVPCSIDEGFEKIGLAQGHGVLLPNQAAVAFNEWREPSHVEFEQRNVFALYQAFTEAAKKGSPALAMQRYPAINEFFAGAVN